MTIFTSVIQSESMFVFSSKVNIHGVIDKLRSLDGIKLAAKKLRKSLLSFDFKLNEKLLDDSDDEEGDEKFENSKTEQLKILKINSLFQIIYCNLHNGRQSTPFRIMNAHSIYEKCRSKEIITQQNRLGLSVSYNKIKQYRSNLAKYAMLKSSENNVPLQRNVYYRSF